MKKSLAAAGLAVALLAAVPASAKELYWRGFDVHAKVDADGRLHIRERQNILFDGDWNGGYRVFRIRPGQRLDFERLLRIDTDTGGEAPLSNGDLSQIDQYKWMDATNLRWRSRLPTDPEFDHKEIDYVLEYTLSNVIRQTDGTYLLDHDFAFPDREGRIEKMTLDLEVDPAWKVLGDFPGHFEGTNLATGRGFVVTARLSRAAPGRPSGVMAILPRWARVLLSLLFLGGLILLAADFARSEGPSGRMASLPSAAIDRAWLDENVFSWRPEDVGALWDDAVGRSEVSAVIARLAGEGKIALHVEKAGLLSHPVLHMKLLRDRGDFSGDEKALINGLFFESRTETDTDSIRQHYRATGFDPAGKIKKEVLARVDSRFSMAGKVPAPAKARTLGIFLVSAALMAGSALLHRGEAMFIVSALFGLLVLGVPAIILGYGSQKKIDGFSIRLGVAVGLTILLGLYPLRFLGYGLTPVFLAGWMGLAFGIASAVFNLAKSREDARRIQKRRTLSIARRFFRTELARRSPALEDAWVPYLLALGLNKHLESWFSEFGGSAAGAAFGSTTTSGAGSSSSSSSAAESSGFTGGGGAFGGAGASVAWVGAMGALSAGVASPGSGSSGGGGGGGGGSSGGGGGGGW